jgi:hypothetical protein
MLLQVFSPNLQAGLSDWQLPTLPVEFSTEDREVINNLTDGIKTVGKDFSKGVTQAGIVLTSTATAVLSAYAVFLIIRYEFSRQPDGHQEERKFISWKTALASTMGTALFIGSIVTLIKSNAIAEYSLKN